MLLDASGQLPTWHGVNGMPNLGQFGGFALQGRWLKDEAYSKLRNAAWLVRNSRTGQMNNPIALRVVVAEVRG